MDCRRKCTNVAHRKMEDKTGLDENESDEKDESKRKMRNLSEKKRRDQFNLLINELCSMVSNNNRKLDKSAVLKSTIVFLREHNETAARSKAQEIEEDWKPSFLTSEEFAHLMLEALDGFIMVFNTTGQILYVSDTVASLLGHLPDDVTNRTIYDLIHEENAAELYPALTSYAKSSTHGQDSDGSISFTCYMKREATDKTHEAFTYQLVNCVGRYMRWASPEAFDGNQSENGNPFSLCSSTTDDQFAFVTAVRMLTPHRIREISICDATKSEFTSRLSLEWKFLFLDHRASPIIGYLPFEVLGTSGYDYYHPEDLERISTCHEALMQTGEGTSCYYRFLTKGQQWIWLQTRYYITYHQWNSKPEFVVCTHTVASIAEARSHLRKEQAGRQDISSTKLGVAMQSSSNENQKSPEVKASSSSMPFMQNELDIISTTHLRDQDGRSDESFREITVSAMNPLINMNEKMISEGSQPEVEPLLSNNAESQNFGQHCVQTQLQEKLHRKHQALQELISQQQEELRSLHQQILMSQGLTTTMKEMDVTNPSMTQSNETALISNSVECIPAMTDHLTDQKVLGLGSMQDAALYQLGLPQHGLFQSTFTEIK